MMKRLIVLLFLVASPAWAAPPPWAKNVKTTVTKDADFEEVVVEVDGVKAGLRTDHGRRYDLVWERDLKTLGLGHRLHAHAITKVFPNERDPVPTPGAHDLSLRDIPTTAADHAPVVIDVNYFYTASAAAARGGEQNMPAFAALSCAIANQAYANSGLGWITMRCLGPWLTTYKEATDGDPLTWMYYSLNPPNDHTSPNYHGNQFQATRTLTGADMSHMVATNNACGVGYINAGITTALSMSEQSCTNANLTFPHETGHVIGYNHEPANAQCGTLVLKPSGLMGCPSGYNYGHSWPIGAVQWRDVMAYPAAGGTRITQFSNPRVLYQGQYPTGVVDERDNARIAEVRAPVVAAFGTPTTTTHKPPSRPTSVTVTQ
jgi:hypothetical protein